MLGIPPSTSFRAQSRNLFVVANHGAVAAAAGGPSTPLGMALLDRSAVETEEFDLDFAKIGDVE